MMSSLTKEYSGLVDYLENQRPTKQKDKRVATKNVKNIIEDCTVDQIDSITALKKRYKDIPVDNPLYHDTPFSKGFDVSRFESLMRMKLVDEHKKIQSYERPFISVTELLGCLRRAYYVRMKFPVDINKMYNFSYLYLINKVGDRIHDAIQGLYDFTDTEKTIVSEKFKVKGRVDAIKDNCVVELKSIDDKKFKNQYIKAHYHQGLVYAYILNTEYEYSIDTITVVYIIRHLKKIIPFDIPYDQALANKFLNYGPQLLLAISAKKAPDPINADNEQCKYCLYKNEFCMKDPIESVKRPFDKTNKKKDPRKSVFLM